MPIIVKIGLNCTALAKEYACLEAFAKQSGVKPIANETVLVSEDKATQTNIIIMQCAKPGTTLKTYFPDRDEEATKILCANIKKLHNASIPESHNFYHLSELFKTLDQKLNIPDEILAKAKHLRDELLKSTTKEVLLHGDLHHDNILKNGDDWLAIDPNGFIGDPAFEPAAYLCNPIPELLQENQPREIIKNRISICSTELGIDSRRITNWLYAKSVLCWAWSLEDNLDPEYWPKFLENLKL